jgi:deoxyribodipyrimidine photolyase-related protein
MTKVRNLIVVLGDQLDHQSPALSGFDTHRDLIWMAEVAQESEHVPSSKIRTTLFLSTMRHFAKAQRELGRTVQYVQLDDPDNTQTLAGELARAIQGHQPEQLVMTQPGDYRVLKAIEQCATSHATALTVLTDSHFITTLEEFSAHAKGRKQLRLEYFYREVRHKTGLLMQNSEPVGGQWNFDEDNRGAFGKQGPGRDRPGEFPVQGPCGRPEPLQLACQSSPSARSPAGLYPREAAPLWSLPRCHVVWPSLALSLTPVF